VSGSARRARRVEPHQSDDSLRLERNARHGLQAAGARRFANVAPVPLSTRDDRRIERAPVNLRRHRVARPSSARAPGRSVSPTRPAAVGRILERDDLIEIRAELSQAAPVRASRKAPALSRRPVWRRRRCQTRAEIAQRFRRVGDPLLPSGPLGGGEERLEVLRRASGSPRSATGTRSRSARGAGVELQSAAVVGSLVVASRLVNAIAMFWRMRASLGDRARETIRRGGRVVSPAAQRERSLSSRDVRLSRPRSAAERRARNPWAE